MLDRPKDGRGRSNHADRSLRVQNPDRASDSGNWYVVLALGFVVLCCILYKCYYAESDETRNTSLRASDLVREYATEQAPDIAADAPRVGLAGATNTAPRARAPTYTREQETCDSMSLLFGRPFIKVRPAFLINPETGRRLEIDCYNDELKVGAEFNGIGHYTWPNPFHRTEAEFHAQLRRDSYKRTMCEQAGVKLFIVPDSVRKGRILEFLRKLRSSTP